MYKMIILVLSIVSIGLSSAQLVQNLRCDPNINLMNGFNVEQFLGKWHIVHRTEKPDQPIDCSHLEIVRENGQIQLYERAVNQNFAEEVKSPAIHYEGTAKFNISRSNSNKPTDFWIVETDYTSYALAYACEDDASSRKVTIWQLGREPSFPPNGMVEARMNQLLTTLIGVNTGQLTPVNHSETSCKTLPDIPPGQNVILPGQCNPNMPVVQNFNVSGFLGEWIGISSYYSANQFGNCGRARYTLSGSTVIVENSAVLNQRLEVIRGTAVVSSTDNSARLLVTLEVQPGIFADAPLWVLATDYDNYAVSYTCQNMPNNQRQVFAWIVSRTRELSSQAQAAVDDVINREIDLNKRFFRDADNSYESCFYFPEPVRGQPVVFPGQCELNNVRPMPNFQAARYMGLWHTIESYPSRSSDGECNNALYTLNTQGGFVEVFNTQVKNEMLLTINGTARVASSDGTAQLTVNFPIPGTDSFSTANYWVLDTDYTNYALVYSCANLDKERQQVTTFKLGREKQLTAANNTAINRILETADVLDQRYFERKDQSREGCFYYPEPQPGGRVVFPGQCSDADVQVVQNFNVAAFEGVWNEIQAYPKEQQPGQCVSHNFTALNTGFILTTAGVIDRVRDTFDSSVARAATDGSAKFVIAIRGNNEVITIPYWIVDTDYSNYALAYSCVDIDSDSRAVYSWILSRSKQLSSSSVSAINNAIQKVKVLENRYFERVDQSDSACFYLPELPRGESVILNGQCDPNIQVVQNFNVAAYLGRWRRISSYPEPFQNGKCNQATYSLNPVTSNVDVYNTQVVNGVFDFLNGTAGLASNDGSAKLWVEFPTTPERASYWVLDTDYVSFALVYSCRDLPNNQRRVSSWKLSRTDQLTPSAIQRINQVINRIDVLHEPYFEIDDQSDEACFYLPPPGSDTPIFPGQCDDTIPVVPNFDAAAYLGQWYDIASYNTAFQQGTCNSAFYSLGDGVVDVFNTQVIDRKLDTMNGIAQVVSTDGSAKLNVTFPIVGTSNNITTPYWVLATDYRTFSLVYTCVNLDSERRQVWSWKLSRTKQLTPAAITAINRVTATIPVLDDRYYNLRDHTREGCFYFPEPVPGVPVVFPGQCNETDAQAMQNFNRIQFQGTWNEIQAYPKEQQPGQCVSHTFTALNTGFSLTTTGVIDRFLAASNSSVAQTTTDGSAKFTITTRGNNGDITIPYWILDTDYSNYALAYSCMDINSTFRAVYSWKLSRSKELSSSSVSAINNAIQKVKVLEDRYFERIDQSDSACFYLPELQPGEPVILNGQCDPNIQVVQNFDVAAYLGRWRRISSYPEPFQNGKCNQATYSLNPVTSNVDVYNTQVVNGVFDFLNGTAGLASNDGSAKLWVEFPGIPGRAPYWVLDTDYVSFALVYSCRDLPNNQRRVSSWKLSRTDELTPSAIQRINQVINRIDVLHEPYFEIDDQSDEACFYLPPPGPDTPIFPGQCDETIPVVPNFDAVAYLGQWYDIASYNTAFQQGTCNSAFYSLGDGVVDVFNTQVVDRKLDTMTGIAEVVSTDGSAKLNVTFPIVGTSNNITTPYWVLATDYRTFSLVYTCVNLDSERRQVWSWKLSRTRQLTNAANTLINNVIATVPVLNEQYYVQRDHSDDGCFYYPEADGNPVVFPGQCDTTIQAVPNFNMTNFQGIWHEIEAYPKDQQSGQCINHQYVLMSTGDYMNLISNNVINETRGYSTGRVRFASAQDSSGKLEITLTSQGTETPIIIPFWILSTDYKDYALAYSCVNINPNQRAVYSWKLSRSKELSAAANTSINNKISEVEVLDNQYYEKIDQSDNACFYLPDNILPGDPVIIPGQCDRTIGVVQNFDAARYLGRWRTIESYPSEFQSGDCQEANYALGTDVVDVFNTQVINQILDTINGSAVVDGTDGSGRLLVDFPNAPTAEYWILDTDYDTFALVYSCVNINSEKFRVWSWKLSRTRELTPEAKARIDRVVSSINVLNERFYVKIAHSDDACFYYPTPDGNPVVFRGQCDQNIPVVTGFDAVAYMGTWYDIEGYPVQFQDGTCPSATYSLSSTGVDVFNTQVVGQQLDTIRGSAVLASNDTSAKLIVTFPIAGTNNTIDTPYWVLATDYTGFSLVYTCVDIDEENRRVASWKLSRNKTLSSESRTAIDRVIETIPVLKEDYYVVRGHTEEDCFYYPDNEGGPVILSGQCNINDINIVNQFNITEFAGTWYEISHFPSERQDGECISREFNTENEIINIRKDFVSNERKYSATALATLSPDGRGILNVTLTDDPITGGPVSTIFYVLDVEYNDFALLYRCRNIDDSHKQIYSYKYSRSQTGLSQTAITRINKIVRETKPLFEDYYENTDQTVNGCFHYPRFDELPPTIELLGPCDTRIRAKANFDVAAYLGKWYEIASYPQPFQFGQCARAQYNLGDGVVDVINTQVVNQTLDVQLATAVVASTDGSGLLNVTFNLPNGVVNSVNYYVLETDYNNFSLVYSCDNLDSGFRRVTSWILSRQTTLSQNARPIIDRIINETQGLIEDYYTPTSQTAEDCFYIPELNKNEAPLFRGQCGNITGVAGFDIQKYLGWWHEIESYPTDNDRGVCRSSEFRQVLNEYHVVDKIVSNNVANTNTSVVTVTNDGRLTRTDSNGQTVDTWVLATDYETYSLLYSCENVDSQYMRVWSAKHSKSRQLTAAAQEAMSKYIETTNTLEPQFYLPVDQSDSACLHYPGEPGNQVILRGQCDTTIPIVQQFKVPEYGGTWYQIERYPQIHENGSCIGARYTLNEDTGVVAVLNWQVVNGVLDQVEGTATVNSTDGSAKLLVTLPIRFTEEAEPTMVEMELYVLITDYSNYSLAYSCVNIDPHRRAVGAWKLSRSRSLNEQSRAAIDAYMARRPELHQPYFIQVEQNEECAEPSSAILIKSSVIIMLICSILHYIS